MKLHIFKLAALLVTGSVALPQGPLTAYTAHQGIQWKTNYNQALKESNATNRPVILFFTGSDWCTWCTKLEQEVLDQQSFAAQTAGKYIFVKLDYPRRASIDPQVKQQNAQLQRQYNITGYPTLLIVDGQENVLAQTGYQQGGPDRYASHLEQLVGRQQPQYIAATPQPVMEESAYDVAMEEFELKSEALENGAALVEEVVQPLVSYVDSHPQGENVWEAQMKIAEVYYENDRLDDALLYATYAHDGAPQEVKTDIQNVISAIEMDLKDQKELAERE